MGLRAAPRRALEPTASRRLSRAHHPRRADEVTHGRRVRAVISARAVRGVDAGVLARVAVETDHAPAVSAGRRAVPAGPAIGVDPAIGGSAYVDKKTVTAAVVGGADAHGAARAIRVDEALIEAALLFATVGGIGRACGSIPPALGVGRARRGARGRRLLTAIADDGLGPMLGRNVRRTVAGCSPFTWAPAIDGVAIGDAHVRGRGIRVARRRPLCHVSAAMKEGERQCADSRDASMQRTHDPLLT